MKISHVQILNWEEPGELWWEQRRKLWKEPLIECQITMTLSFREYINLLDQARDGSDLREP